MSTLVALPEPVPLTITDRLTGHLAVTAAHLIATALGPRPRRLDAALRLLARRAVPATAAQTAHARDVVCTLSPRCGSGYGCLPRSLATALLCRLHGRWPTWKTGVRFPPLASHAWNEADGIPIGEDTAHIRTFTATITIPAGGSR
ncbi:hypothetical protein GCM10009801_09100 [Streptomyces albiaxialis]|uniref:Microcin J25-processing protein McjB C-terminal domain-containing protein n=1 Tax=Streptomyces albiaxialis TaxID=329523 RepID=A0ABN2VK15_9ACTN